MYILVAQFIGMGGGFRTLKKLVGALLPVVGCLISFRSFWLYQHLLFPGDACSTAVRLAYAALFSLAMEYVARYNHKYLWHSKQLWWVHGTHHHQYPTPGCPPQYDHGNQYVSPTVEWNDVFPLFFGCVAAVALILGTSAPPSLTKDCWTGVAIGTTVWGWSYFLGHDVVTHERLGKSVANYLRSKWSYLDECAAVHFKYHHKLKKKTGDPYGPPYGFWLGPHEVRALQRGEDYSPMPLPIKASLVASMLYAVYVSCADFRP